MELRASENIIWWTSLVDVVHFGAIFSDLVSRGSNTDFEV